MFLDVIAAAEPFHGVSRDSLRPLASQSAEQTVEAGGLLFSHGDPADAVFLVLDGTVTVYRDQVGKPMQLLARVGPGELLGEMCLFDEDRRSAAARAATTCRLLRLEREPLRRLLAAEPRLAQHIQNTAARRRSLNSAAALQLGQKAEVRIRLRAPARVRLANGTTVPVELENLSIGGLSLRDAPADWTVGVALRFELLADDEPLPVHGRVAWRDGAAVGIAVTDQSPGHELHVYRLLRRLGQA